MNILITGANGFVGKSLCGMLAEHEHNVTPLRRDFNPAELRSNYYDCLIHLAGRAHVMHETTEDIYSAYKSVNVDFTIKVAELARFLGIKRFIFLSSIKVNGEVSNSPYNESDAPAPLDAYGQTKLESELSLKDFCAANQIELVIIRAPLIYGPNVKANFKSLIALCKLPIPLPLSTIQNRRSLIGLSNLNSFIELCCHHPNAGNETFLVSDDEDVSTTDVVRSIRKCLGMPSLVFPIPQSWLIFFLNVIAKKSLATRLCGNLQVDISKAKNLLGWKPPYTFQQGIQRTIQKINAYDR